MIINIQVGHRYFLNDHKNHDYGVIKIMEIKKPWFIGKFYPGTHYYLIQELFAEYEKLINDQIFSLVDDIAEKIEELHFQLCQSEENINCCDIFDVQIMNNTDICFKIKENHFS